MYTVNDLYDFSHSLAGKWLQGFTYPWEALSGIKNLILELGAALGEEYNEVSPTVWVHKTAKIAPTAYLGAPCIIGANTEVRHCAFVRGSALVGENCVVGNSVELKNVILFDNVQVPHYNYVGDSILGYKSHMGAGSITSNVKSDKTPVSVKTELQRRHISKELIEYGLNKAREMGFKICIVEGNPMNYRPRGFVTSARYNVFAAESVGLPHEDCLMIQELVPGALDGVHGYVDYGFYKSLQ